ncbi:MAG: dihydrodipicolinate synthase family protein [Anaerolineae bacterium]
MSHSTPYRGVFTIPSTPFDEEGQMDEEGLRRVVDFCVGCGAHGIVYPVNASEFTNLSDEERLRGSRIVVEQTAGRVPAVVGTAGVCTSHAVMFSRHAEEIGADAVIAMAPYINKVTDAEGLLAYYRAISDAVDIPIFVQNHTVGTDIPVDTLARLVREVGHVEYIKEETMPATHKLSHLMEMELPKLKGVFGGSGGRYLLLEHPRGSAGQMPGCHVTDVVVRLWNALEEGDREEAKRVYGLLAPLYAIEIQCRGAIYKEVLRRRGVIKSAFRRNAPPGVMDEHDHRALDEILADLEPLYTWEGF